MPTIERRLTALEEARPEFSGPLVLWLEADGEQNGEQRRASEEAERIGRLVIRWPVLPPPIECDSAERMQT